MLPKRWLRQAVRMVAGLVVGLLFLAVVDFYLNFLPASVSTKLLMLDAPVVIDVEVRTCYRNSQCAPSGSGWYQHPKNLFLGQKWFQKAYLYTQRVQESELKGDELVVLDVALPLENANLLPQRVLDDISASNPDFTVEPLNENHNRQLAGKIGWKLKHSSGLWVKYGHHRHNSVSQLKVLFGSSARCPLPGWVLLDGSLQMSSPQPRLALRRGSAAAADRVPTLQFRENKFKIVQIADLHMSTDDGVCDHPVDLQGSECVADELTLDFVNNVLDLEHPDLVVFTGDQIMGDRAPDPETALLKALAPVIKRGIPWAMVFGNHDEQSPWDNAQLLEYSQKLPGCLAEAGNSTGVGNYLLKATVNGHTALSMYFMDTHAHTKVKGVSQYDWIHEDQLDEMQQLYKSNKHLSDKYAHISLSMAFFHIPLPEYRSADQSNMVGSFKEAVMAPTYNSGALNVLKDLGVSVMSVGHDHCNDYCTFNNQGTSSAWLCYGGAAGEGGYGGYPDADGVDTQRRIRVFEVDAAASSINSWKWIRGSGEISDFQQLVSNGNAARN